MWPSPSWVPPSSFTWIGPSYLVTHLDIRISPNRFHQLTKTKHGLSPKDLWLYLSAFLLNVSQCHTAPQSHHTVIIKVGPSLSPMHCMHSIGPAPISWCIELGPSLCKHILYAFNWGSCANTYHGSCAKLVWVKNMDHAQ